jgi:pimeloyl-ACP methyl ester carboxylesterase
LRAGGASGRAIGATALTFVVVLALLFVVRNDEHGQLDSIARASAPGKFVRLSDGMVHYDMAGPDTGDAVVLVHGFSVPLYIWDTTFATLRAAGYRVLRYDTFGRGYSDRPRVAYDSALFVRQLDELLDSLRVPRAHLVGLSMGGRVVTQYALAHRTRVRTLTLIDPAFSLQAALPIPLDIALVGEYFYAVRNAPRLAQSQLGDFVHPERHPDWPDRYRVQMRYPGFRRALLSTLRRAAKGNDRAMYARYGELGIPTLLIWGRQDKTVAFAMSDSLRVRVPFATFVPVDSAGHLPQIEQPDITHASMLAFLRKQQTER